MSDPLLADFVDRIAGMNRLADESSGFIWRPQAAETSPDALQVFADYFVPFEPERFFFNMSVWESVEALQRYVYRTAHAGVFSARDRWIVPCDRAQLALWWISVGQVPTIAESVERLRSVHERGPTEFAFTFQHDFWPPTA